MKLIPTADGYVVRLRYGTGRGRFTIKLKDEARARKRALHLQELASELFQNGRQAEARIILDKGASVTSDHEFAEVVKFAKGLKEEKEVKVEPRKVTFKELAEDWVSGKLHEQWPDYVKAKKDVANDRSRLAKLYETVGDVPIVEFSLAHAKKAMATLPKNRTPATRRHYAQLMTKIMRIAVYPLELIERSPLPVGFLPSSRNNKAFSYLYPSEDAMLMSCTDVPFLRRALYGFLAREGCRLGEALSLCWRDLDLQRGAISLDENKTDEPRTWALSPGVAEALAMFKPDGASPDALVFGLVNRDRAAEVFREHLKQAGVDRVQLFERSKNRRPIRIHDLRATFITLALANGRTETWAMDRTGHKSSNMVNHYRRQARQAGELNLGPLQPLNLVLVNSTGGPRSGPNRESGNPTR